MKKLLIFLFFVNLLAACNNTGGVGSGWTAEERNKFMEPCLKGGNKEICTCVLQKLEKKYPTFREADTKGTAEEGRQLALECRNGGGNNNGGGGLMGGMEGNNGDNGNNNGGLNNNENGNNGNNNNGGGNWTTQEHQQYSQQCAGAAQQQGFTAEQANSYCDCMTTKVEQQYSFKEANQLTAADFQTQQWQSAAADCRPKFQ